MKNIVLTGMMGCGKSTVGQALAAALGWEFADMDAEIVRAEGRTIPEIFARDGEAYFRAVETETARGLAGRQSLVIATGGGVVLREENMRALRETGVVVLLDRPASEIFDAVDMDGRPLAGDKAAFLATYAARKTRYFATADAVCTAFSSVEASLAQILAILEKMEDVI
ncbi:MAG: shikimate kinase [Oscillospiraceae bacterium]|nr:shikimate kinase [Oscillospiraceae bacterium]